MNTERSKFRSKEGLGEDQAVQQGAEKQAREFANVEELLRYDSESNPVPDEVAARLNNSIAAEPKPKSWWRNLFGG